MANTMNITYASSLSKLCELNESFDTGVLRVAYHGANRNGSFISKESFERSMETIWNCPVVCNYDRDTESIGAHDMEVITGNNGQLRLVNITQPVGVVPESAKTYWQTIEEDDGSTHEYLCVDVLLWKRQEAYKKILSDGITGQSMEINVRDGAMRDGVFYIDRFSFTAFCLLGSAAPCYESAALEMYSCAEFKQQFSEMMEDMRKTMMDVQPVDQVDIDTHYSEGGDFALEEKNALMAEFNIDPESLDFDLNEFSVDELREKFEAMHSADIGSVTDPVADPVETFALTEQVREELMEAVRAEKIATEWGDMSRYCFVDYDYEAMELYCYDASDWKLYGMNYTMDGDSVVIDFESKKRKKYAIVDFEESQHDGALTVFAEAFSVASEKYAQINRQLSDETERANFAESEAAALKQFKETAEVELSQYRLKAFREKFTDLNGNDEFENLCERMSDYSVADFEEKCYAIRGRNSVTAKFAHEPMQPRLQVMNHNVVEPTDEPYNGLFIKYGKKAN